MAKQQRIEVVTNLRGPVRREVLQGREHFVVPSTLVRSQVLRNNLGVTFLPAEDITPEWANISNASPVVTDHPSGASVRTPETLNAMGIGTLLRVRVENGALKGDVFLDPVRVRDVPDLQVILNRLEKEEKVELSTGFPVAVDETPGVHNGEEYERVIHPRGGLDHLAVFAEKKGACSVADGCGLAVNHEGPCETEETTVDEETQGKFAQALDKLVAFLSRAEEPPADPPAEEAETDSPDGGGAMNRDTMIAKLAEAGRDRDVLAKLSDCDLKALLGAGAEPEPMSENEALALAHRYRRENEELRKKYEPAANEQEKERVELLDDLLYNASNLAWEEDEIREMDIVQLRKVHRTAFPKRHDYSGRGGPRASNAVGSFDFVTGIMDGPAGTSALDKKEVN